MQITSIVFMIFFAIVVLIYYTIPNKFKKIWLLLTNYCFIVSFSLDSLACIIFITVISYFVGLLLENKRINRNAVSKKITMASGIGCILILYLFKMSISFGAAPVICIGLSFYFLEAAGYLIHVYDSTIPAERNCLHFAIFLSFFPKLQSGPIEKADVFLPQLLQQHEFDYDKVKNGLLRMVWGVLEKIAIADMLSILISAVYDNYCEYSGFLIILCTVLYAFQLYGDFDGYSNIAVGAAGILGYDLTINFQQPYFSASVGEFWRRWHISLNNWLRTYIYIPLGGNRRGNLLKGFNTMIVFICSGLWHGCDITFLVWGGG